MPDCRNDIVECVQAMDQKSFLKIEAAWAQLRPLGFGVVPYLRDAYSNFSHGEGRTALVYYATRYARQSDEAFELGVAALGDRAYAVRSRACGLLAYAQKKEALAELKQIAREDPRDTVRDDAKAAMRAIKRRNHHLFIDREGSGRVFWRVNPGDQRGP